MNKIILLFLILVGKIQLQAIALTNPPTSTTTTTKTATRKPTVGKWSEMIKNLFIKKTLECHNQSTTQINEHLETNFKI